MPVVTVTMVEGRDTARKARMVADVTEAIVQTLEAPRESVRVIIHEVPPWHFAVGGVLKGEPPG